jgi:16S rRNA (cytosine967-C5)-methyltransferase
LSRYHSYINSAKNILSVYKGSEPLSSFLKKYFSSNKKYGSKDRKQISHLCYCFFRLGKAVINVTTEEKLLIALFLCSDTSSEILKTLKTEWNNKNELPLHEKLLLVDSSLSISNIFPWNDELSEGMDHEKFCESFFIQPNLFLRLRPGKERIVIQKLQQAGIDFKMITETCLALPNASKIDEIVELDKEAVIQDYSSQQTGSFLSSVLALSRNDKLSVWDCCAGSGGKSIMAYDIDSKIELTVSDTRESILANLKKRFAIAGIKNYKSIIANLEDSNFQFSTSNFQLVFADVPCSGSGTWSRTPEQLYFFNERRIEEYSTLQKRIASNAIPQLQPGGTFIYITCSVFKKENEEVVMFIKENFHLKLKQMEILKGYDKKADSMFVAVLSLPKH